MHTSERRYLDVDLSAETVRDYEIPAEWTESHIGGRGVAARLLLHEFSGRETALSSGNILVFAAGPLQGTGVLGAGRHVVMAISPKTQSVCDSYAGGYLGHELGQSDYDGILFRGTAGEPTYLTLLSGRAELRPASDLWGEGTGATEDVLRARHPGGRVRKAAFRSGNLRGTHGMWAESRAGKAPRGSAPVT